MLRTVRNASLILFASMALVVGFQGRVQAFGCLDVSGIDLCADCGNRTWYGTCYTTGLDDNCGSFNPACTSSGPATNCDGQQPIYICLCPQCA
jgi:hypothetical protein